MPEQETLYGFDEAAMQLVADAVRNYLDQYRPEVFGDFEQGVTPFGQDELVLGKTDATHNKGATGTVSVYGLLSDTIGSETDTGENIDDVYNRMDDVGSGKWVYLYPSAQSGTYEIVAFEP